MVLHILIVIIGGACFFSSLFTPLVYRGGTLLSWIIAGPEEAVYSLFYILRFLGPDDILFSPLKYKNIGGSPSSIGFLL